jgi:gas vesicle protein
MMARTDTEPYEQLLSNPDVEVSCPSGKDHERNKQRRYQDKVHPAYDDRPQRPVCDYAEEPSELSHPEDSMSVKDFVLSFVSDRIRETKGYRLVISLSITALFLIVSAAYGRFEDFGVTGFARADVIKSKIESATQPLERKINQQTTLLTEISKQLTDQLAAGTASEIRLSLSKLCSEMNRDERERLNKEIDRLQSQYFNYKLMRYEPPPCAQL